MRVWWIRTHDQLFHLLISQQHDETTIEYVCRILRVFVQRNYTHRVIVKYIQCLCQVMIMHKGNRKIRRCVSSIMYRLIVTYPSCLRIVVADLLHEINYSDYDRAIMPLIVLTVMFDCDAKDTQQLLEKHRLSLAIAIKHSLTEGGSHEMVLFLFRMLLQAGHRDAIVSANINTVLFSVLDNLPPTFRILRELFFIAQNFRVFRCPSWSVVQEKLLLEGPLSLNQDCAICTEEVATNPITLRCGHAYCRQCLQDFIKSRLEGCMSCLEERPPTCPQCRGTVTCKDMIRIM